MGPQAGTVLPGWYASRIVKRLWGPRPLLRCCDVLHSYTRRTGPPARTRQTYACAHPATGVRHTRRLWCGPYEVDLVLGWSTAVFTPRYGAHVGVGLKAQLDCVLDPYFQIHWESSVFPLRRRVANPRLGRRWAYG